jgi:hypothetical protein
LTIAYPFKCCKRIIDFANALIVRARALFGATKVEPQRKQARPRERTRQCVRNFIVHRTAVLWVGMTNNCGTGRRAIGRRIQGRLKAANRPTQPYILRLR